MSSRVDGCKRLIDGLHVFSLVRFPFAPSISRFFLFFLILFMVFYLNLSLKLFAFLCIESKFMIFSFYFNLFFWPPPSPPRERASLVYIVNIRFLSHRVYRTKQYSLSPQRISFSLVFEILLLLLLRFEKSLRLLL